MGLVNHCYLPPAYHAPHFYHLLAPAPAHPFYHFARIALVVCLCRGCCWDDWALILHFIADCHPPPHPPVVLPAFGCACGWRTFRCVVFFVPPCATLPALPPTAPFHSALAPNAPGTPHGTPLLPLNLQRAHAMQHYYPPCYTPRLVINPRTHSPFATA